MCTYLFSRNDFHLTLPSFFSSWYLMLSTLECLCDVIFFDLCIQTSMLLHFIFVFHSNDGSNNNRKWYFLVLLILIYSGSVFFCVDSVQYFIYCIYLHNLFATCCTHLFRVVDIFCSIYDFGRFSWIYSFYSIRYSVISLFAISYSLSFYVIIVALSSSSFLSSFAYVFIIVSVCLCLCVWIEMGLKHVQTMALELFNKLFTLFKEQNKTKIIYGYAPKQIWTMIFIYSFCLSSLPLVCCISLDMIHIKFNSMNKIKYFRKNLLNIVFIDWQILSTKSWHSENRHLIFKYIFFFSISKNQVLIFKNTEKKGFSRLEDCFLKERIILEWYIWTWDS